jgi:hypothetical protein
MNMRRSIVAAFGATLLAAGTSAGVAHAAIGNIQNHQTATGGAGTAVVGGTITVTAANSAVSSTIAHSPTRGANVRTRVAAKNGNQNANNKVRNATGNQRFTIG